MLNLISFLIFFIYIASALAIFIAVLIFAKRNEKHEKLKVVHVYNRKIISEEEAKKYEVEYYETIDNIIFVYHIVKY